MRIPSQPYSNTELKVHTDASKTGSQKQDEHAGQSPKNVHSDVTVTVSKEARRLAEGSASEASEAKILRMRNLIERGGFAVDSKNIATKLVNEG